MRGFENHFPKQLSGGMQQRTAIARALANSPKLVLADEPTGALDSRTGHEIMALFRKLNREQGITVVVVTHRPGILRVADRMLLLHDGAQQAFGTPQQVLASINQALAAQQPAGLSA